MMKIKLRRFLLLAIFMLPSGLVFAQQESGRTLEFIQLPAQEQNLLKAAMPMWSKLDPKAQLQLRMQAQHWLKLSPPEQQTLLLKQRQWDSLSFSDKSKERSRYAAWQSLGTLDQVKISAAYRQWRLLSVDKQQALKAKFSQQLPEYQQAWILGPTLGKEAQVLEDWLLFIPQEQIKPWLMLLRELTPEDRSMLVKLGKHMNQQRRDTFRTRLLSAPVTARAGMIAHALEEQL
ncbi:MAG: DUF3106 domain-containing protein [Arenimonas sp.]